MSFDPSKWIPPSWRGTWKAPDGTLYRITSVYSVTKQPIYDFKLPNEPWQRGYIGRYWNYFNKFELVKENT